MSRDLLADLWPASFRGIPFYVERDNEDGGRRLAIHQFYGRDDPYIEDLGADLSRYDVACYLVGDTYDDDTLALVVALRGTAGPGTLVLPLQGQVTAHLHTFRRDRTLDRTGYIGFQAQFVRAGSSVPLASTTYLAQMAFDAVGALIAATAAPVAVVGQPGFVADATVSGLRDVLAGFETIRAGATIDPATSSGLAVALTAAYAAVPGQVDAISGLASGAMPGIAALAVTLAEAMDPSRVVAAFGAAFDAVPDAPAPDLSRAVSTQTIAANAAALASAERLALLSAYVTGVLKATYPTRQAGIAARADVVERFDVALATAVIPDGGALITALEALRGAAVAYLSSLITNLAPVVTVTMPVPLPAIVLAWRLYADPTRWGEIIDRNAVAHPSFVPTTFEALAPARAA